jgi:hypothetical protein
MRDSVYFTQIPIAMAYVSGLPAMRSQSPHGKKVRRVG